MGLLSLILWTPLLGALAILFMPKSAGALARNAALVASGASLIGAIYAAMQFDPTNAAMQFVERREWVPEMGMSYALGLDGIALAMVLLTTFISFLCILASKAETPHVRAYFTWMMVLEAAVIGVFSSLDWFLFYMFWEITLIPMFFLIGIWGGARRSAASLSFFLYTLTGSVFMLLAIVAAYATSPGHSFDMASLAAAAAGWSTEFQIMVFAGFVIGLGVKVPIFPMHGWLPVAHVEAPVPVSMFLSAVMLKMGAYGLLRAGVMVPAGLDWFVPALFVLGLINLIYGALLAWKQTDLKAMVAYSSISHMGFVLIGISAVSVIGISGAVLQMIAHGIASAALFYLVGVLYDRAQTRDVTAFSGLGRQMPIYAVSMSVALLAAMGLPGLAGLVAEFHVIAGAYARFDLYVLFISVGVLITAAFTLRTIALLFTGAPDPQFSQLEDLTLLERATALPLVALLLLLGIVPSLALVLINPAIVSIVDVLGK